MVDASDIAQVCRYEGLALAEIHEMPPVSGERCVDGVHRTLRKAFNDAVRVEQLLPSNPAVRATRPRARGKERADLWTTEQLHTFLDVAAGHRIGAFYRLAAYTGARRGELTHMRWSDLDLDAAELTITGSAATIGAVRVEGTTKGGRSRVVSLDAGTIEVMHAHRKAQLAEQLAARTWWQDGDGLVFLRRGRRTDAHRHPDRVDAEADRRGRPAAHPAARPAAPARDDAAAGRCSCARG